MSAAGTRRGSRGGRGVPPWRPISKGPELSDPLDPDSPETDNTIFVLDEFYESPAGPVEHWRLARSSDPTESWPEDLHALIPWSAKCKLSTLHSGTVVQDLW